MEAGPRNRAQQPDSGAETAPLTDDGPDTRDGLSGAAGDPLTDPGTWTTPRVSTPVPRGPARAVSPSGNCARRAGCGCGSWRRSSASPLSARLMFAFPLAFEFGGDGGAVIAMLGLLLCCCAAGWGMMAARRVHYAWPGLPVPGSGGRAGWRVVLIYALVVAVPAALAIWRVARLR